MLAGMPGGFSQASPVSRHLPIGPSHTSYNNLERDVKLNKNDMSKRERERERERERDHRYN